MLKGRVVRVAFASGVAPSESEYFEEISQYKKKTLWFLLLFITRTMIPMANGIQMTYYVKLNIVEGMCYIPELKNVDWTYKQIIRITEKHGNNLSQKVGICEYLGYDYKRFARLNYSAALKLKNKIIVPEIKNCIGQRILLYENTNKFRNLDLPFCHSGVLAKRMFFLKNASMAIGGIISGILGDLFGRRKMAIIVASLWSICSLFLSSLPAIGASVIFSTLSYCFNFSLDLLTYINLFELCHKKIRIFTVLTFYGRNAVFVFLTRLTSTMNFNWNYLLHLHFYFSLISLFHCWYVPESPRWLIGQSRYKEALDVMKEVIGHVPNEILFEDEGTDTAFYIEILKNSFRYLKKRKLQTIVIMTIISAILGFVDETQIIGIMESNFVNNGLIAGNSAYLLSLFYVMIIFGAFGKKYGLFWALISMSFGSFVTLCLRESVETVDIRATTFLLMTTYAAEMIVLAYLPDLFPTFLRCTTLGISFFFSSIARIVTVQLIDWREMDDSTFYLAFLLISLPGFFVLKLPDTTLNDLLTTRLFRV